MPYFRDADDVYANLGKLLVDLVADPELGLKFRQANTVVRYEFSNPASEITVKLLKAEDGAVELGQSAIEPEVTMSMDADVAHRFWLGKVSPTVALAKGQMKAKGPVAKILRLVPIAKPAFPRYRQQIQDAGRADLLEGIDPA